MQTPRTSEDGEWSLEMLVYLRLPESICCFRRQHDFTGRGPTGINIKTAVLYDSIQPRM